MSRAADGTSAVQDLDFASLRSQLGPLAAVSARNVNLYSPILKFCESKYLNIFHVLIG